MCLSEKDNGPEGVIWPLTCILNYTIALYCYRDCPQQVTPPPTNTSYVLSLFSSISRSPTPGCCRLLQIPAPSPHAHVSFNSPSLDLLTCFAVFIFHFGTSMIYRWLPPHFEFPWRLQAGRYCPVSAKARRQRIRFYHWVRTDTDTEGDLWGKNPNEREN